MRKESRKPRPKEKEHGPSFVWVEVSTNTKPTLEDLERAINKKLAAEPTDLFHDTRTVVIVAQREGGRPQ